MPIDDALSNIEEFQENLPDRSDFMTALTEERIKDVQEILEQDYFAEFYIKGLEKNREAVKDELLIPNSKIALYKIDYMLDERNNFLSPEKIKEISELIVNLEYSLYDGIKKNMFKKVYNKLDELGCDYTNQFDVKVKELFSDFSKDEEYVNKLQQIAYKDGCEKAVSRDVRHKVMKEIFLNSDAHVEYYSNKNLKSVELFSFTKELSDEIKNAELADIIYSGLNLANLLFLNSILTTFYVMDTAHLFIDEFREKKNAN
jgi:hypothetical protein